MEEKFSHGVPPDNSPEAADARTGEHVRAGNRRTEQEPPPSERNDLFDNLPEFPLGEPLDKDEMRITFFGTSCIPRLSQECNSIFVEVGSKMGWGDQFVFDCGTGVTAKYTAMGIPKSKMNKIFMTHLHGDHTSDLIHIYCFGPSEDRKFPLYLWGPGKSGLIYTDPLGKKRGPFEDGLRTFCEQFRGIMRWHTESFSFGHTRFANPDRVDNIAPSQNHVYFGVPAPDPVGFDSDWPDDPYDAYAIYPYELNEGSGVAYDNKKTGVKITYFPVIHCRKGSIGYKLEWNNMSLIFSGDTKPTYTMLDQATGVDVLIHEMVMSADTWTTKNTGLTEGDQGWEHALEYTRAVQDSSHTPQGAFGYILSQLSPPPRLAIATHFQAADDTMYSALKSVKSRYEITDEHDFTFASDLMVFNVSPTSIRQRRAVVSSFAFNPPPTKLFTPSAVPLYWTYGEQGMPTYDPYAQIDRDDEIPRENEDGTVKWDENGY